MRHSTSLIQNTIFIGMDVHKDSYTLCCYTIADNRYWGHLRMEAKPELILSYIDRAKEFYDVDANVVCGYEAGCLGYNLQRFLAKKGISCVILAPSTMKKSSNERKLKTDKRDAETIASCLAMNGYKPVFVPTKQDEEIKCFIRMREDHVKLAKALKQEINAFCLSQGKRYSEGKHYWTQTHMDWLNNLPLSPIDRETLDTYLLSLARLNETLQRLDKRIEEFAQLDAYRENVKKLCCFIGVRVYTAMAIIVEIGDFQRFGKAENFAAYVGLVPGEHSSDKSVLHLSITKAGNSHVRRLITESSQCYSRGKPGFKSAVLKKRQANCTDADVAYADRCNERLRRKCQRMKMCNKPFNVAKTAVARELACFIWGMITGHHNRSVSTEATFTADTLDSHQAGTRGRPLSFGQKKEVSPVPPSRKKGRGVLNKAG